MSKKFLLLYLGQIYQALIKLTSASLMQSPNGFLYASPEVSHTTRLPQLSCENEIEALGERIYKSDP